MTKVFGILFPHQLFRKHPLPGKCSVVYLVEEFLFFRQYGFHKQKLAFHRASMKAYQRSLEDAGIKTVYVSSIEETADIRRLIPVLAERHAGSTLYYIDPTDEWLSKRLKRAAHEQALSIREFENPSFFNSRADLRHFFRKEKQSYFQTTFYKQQRRSKNILMKPGGQPVGGKWTYDADNRKKFPRSQLPPPIRYPAPTPEWEEAVQYVEKHYPENPGSLPAAPLYPTDHEGAQAWLQQFFELRFRHFGDYEDAIVANASILHHSVLSPLLNTGMLQPDDLLDQCLNEAALNDIPLNSTEGFVRQLIGWREFIRGMYECKGNQARTTNFWGFDRKIPASFYNGTTGIEPVDITIRKLLKTGYNHHIERLMVLGSFMLLCEFDPDEVYRWFMELYIDAYDWVMVPNVYGMSQFADGGSFATKPYISGSNYLMKMGDFRKGPWQSVWDGLFWRFMHTHRDFFLGNPRLGMLVHTFDKMSEEKKSAHLQIAEDYLKSGLK